MKDANMCVFISCLVLSEDKESWTLKVLARLLAIATVELAVNKPFSLKFFEVFFHFFLHLKAFFGQFSMWNETCHDVFETLFWPEIIAGIIILVLFSFVMFFFPSKTGILP